MNCMCLCVILSMILNVMIFNERSFRVSLCLTSEDIKEKMKHKYVEEKIEHSPKMSSYTKTSFFITEKTSLNR